MSYITAQELQDASIDAGTLEKFALGGVGEQNLNREGVDVETLQTIKERTLEVARQAANMQTYLTKEEADAAQPQHKEVMAQVTNDPAATNNGYWVSNGAQWLWSGIQPLGNSAFLMRGAAADGVSLGSLSSPGSYMLAAGRSYSLMPDDAVAGAAYWLEVLPIGDASNLETTGRFVQQRLTSVLIIGGRRKVWVRRLDRQNPNSLIGANGWAPVLPGSEPGLALLLAESVNKQRDLLGMPEEMTFSPRLSPATGTDLSSITQPGIYVLFSNGGYSGAPEGFDSGSAHWLTVSPGKLPNGSASRFVHVEIASMTVKMVDGRATRDVFTRRLDLTSPMPSGGNGRWVQMSGAPSTAPKPNNAETCVPYVHSGALRVTDFDGDRVINDDAASTWIAAQVSAGEIQAVREIGGVRSVVSVASDTGDIFAAVETELKLGAGQSNGRGSQNGDPSFVIEPWLNTHGERLCMPGPNVWANTGTTGTAIFDPVGVAALAPYQQHILTNCGPSAVEAAALRYADRAFAAGLKPRQIVANVAVGSSSMAMLNDEPPIAGNTRWSNLVAILERIYALRRNEERIRCRWIDMHQGEGDYANAALGHEHEGYRARIEGEIQRIFGQTANVKMLTWQNAAYSTYKAGVYSLIDYHIENAVLGGDYWCAGPCYEFPLTAEFLHHNARGHMMRGEFADEIMRRIDRYGEWAPLYMKSAAVTGTNEITVTLTHPAVIDTTHPRVAPIENAGITLDGGAVSSVSVSGLLLTITTSGPASNVVAVQAAFVGQSSPRTAERIPRTNIRGTEDLGRYRTSNENMRRWLCPQSIAVM